MFSRTKSPLGGGTTARMKELSNEGRSQFVFLHGGGQGSWVWQDLIEALVERHGIALQNMLALDAPGCGSKRGWDTTQISFSDLINALVADVESSEFDQIILVGHSQAGNVMPFMIERLGKRLRHVVYVACSIPEPHQTPIEMMGEGMHGDHSDQVGWPVDPKITPPAEQAMAMFCNDMTPDAATHFLSQLGSDMWPACSYTHRDWAIPSMHRVPATFIGCERDASLPPAWQEIFARRLGAQEMIYLDAGHQVMNTQPQQLAEQLVALS